MATTQFTETKQVRLSDIVEDLSSGLTKWKKDDIGFGSIEKKYNLTIQECIKLFSEPKIANLEHRIPTFVIIDDLPETTAPQATVSQTIETERELPTLEELSKKVFKTEVKTTPQVIGQKTNLDVAF